jgi:hypothetical protein
MADQYNPHRDKEKEFLWAVLIGIGALVIADFFSYKFDPQKLPVEWYLPAWIIFLFTEVAAFIFILSKTPILRWLIGQGKRCSIATGAALTVALLIPRWIRYVTKGASIGAWKIRYAVAKEYLHEERLDLDGKADLASRKQDGKGGSESRPLLVTNFVRYSKLVEAVVNAATNAHSGQRKRVILCVTTLNMRLEKWFNFDEESRCSHDDWQAYLEFLQKNIVPRSDFILARVLLVRKVGSPSGSERIKLQSLDDLRNELKNYIWLSKTGSDTTSGTAPLKLVPLAWRPDPLGYEPRQNVFKQLNEEFDSRADLKTELNALSKRSDKNRRAYVILPSTLFSAPPSSNSGGEFKRLGDEFMTRFHTRAGLLSYYAYYKEVDPVRYLPVLDSDTAHLPLDFYYVGVIEDRTTEEISPSLLSSVDHRGLFCLAATPDENLNMTYLYLVDPERSPNHFKEIEKYVKELLTDPQFISSLLP